MSAASVTQHVGRRLTAALQKFFEDAVRLRTELVRERGFLRLAPSVQDFAGRLAELESCRAADRAALAAARANGYAVTDNPRLRRAGRALNLRQLVSLGIASLLRDEPDSDWTAVANDVAQVLAGPRTPVWRYLLTDMDVEIEDPVQVVDGWELVRPSRDQLLALMPVPAAYMRAADSPLNVEQYAGMTMFRKEDPLGQPHVGHHIYLATRHEAIYWQPALVVNLYSNDVVQSWGLYRIEPQRHVERIFDSVRFETVAYGETEVSEEPARGACHVDREEVGRFTRFCAEVGRIIDRLGVASAGQPARRLMSQLRLMGQSFLLATEKSHQSGGTLNEDNADVTFLYVTVLEALLAGDDDDRLDLSRKTSQRAAVLVGRTDTERVEIAHFVRSAYSARSKYAHGAEPREVDIPRLRQIVRECLVGRLVLASSAAVRAGEFSRLLDDALLSSAVLHASVREPVEAFGRRVNQRGGRLG